jgi:hypothetical protein
MIGFSTLARSAGKQPGSERERLLGANVHCPIETAAVKTMEGCRDRSVHILQLK